MPSAIWSGSISFEGGDRNQATDPKKCCRNWSRDFFGEQWKPDEPDASGVDRFEVSIAAAGCPSSVMVGQTVEIDYTENNTTSTFTFYLEPYFWFGHQEPKIDSPVKLRDAQQLQKPRPLIGSTAPGVLQYGSARGAITRVKVGAGAPCRPTGPAVVTVQPKRAPK